MQITYQPRLDGDPAFVKIKGGHVLRAGEPKEINDPEVCAWAPNNPWFKCEGKGLDAVAQSAKSTPKDAGWDKRRKPKSSDDYCAYAIAWINEAMPDETDEDGERAAKNCKTAMRARWDGESDLRVACGVGEDDLDRINGIYGPKLAQLGG
jgi:hypothetical protein